MSSHELEAALVEIRDSTYRNALQLRSIADRALQAHRIREQNVVLEWRSGDPIPYTVTPAGKAALNEAQSVRDEVRDSLANIKGGRW